MNFETSRRDFILRASAALGAATMGGRLIAAAAGGSAPVDQTPNGPVALAPPDKQPDDLPIPKTVEKKVGYAIVGLGQLALGEILPAFRKSELCEAVALVSGHAEKARKVAAAYHIPADAIYSYERFEELAKNPRVDVVYIVLPNSLHEEYTIRAFQAGKHVLCEKPMAPTPEACERMIAAGQQAGKKLMIAYRLHYEPFNAKVAELCQSKALGRVKVFSASNCQSIDAPNIRLSNATAGGPLGDVGVYCINAGRYITGEEPVEVTATSFQPTDDPRFREVPESLSFTLRYPSGALGMCDCSFGTAESRYLHAVGTEASLHLENAFGYTGQVLKVKAPNAKTGAIENGQLSIEAKDHFASEMDYLAGNILSGEKAIATPGEMGLADTRIVAAITEAAKTGRTVKVAR